MKIKIIKKKMLWFLGNHLVGLLIRVLCKTLFYNEQNKHAINNSFKNNTNFVAAFWHGTMVAPWYVLRNRNFDTIISKSNDGNILANLLSKWGYGVNRGSSSKGGKEVLEELILSAKNGKSIAITPDGPKGPSKSMKAGAVIIAKKSGIPVVLVGVNYKNSIKLKSWDRFEIPFFFSKVQIVYSDPIYIDSNLTYEETDIMINTLEIELNKLQELVKTN